MPFEMDSPEFQSTPPARGGDYWHTSGAFVVGRFQSTPPARGATLRQGLSLPHRRFQSTPPAKGATLLNPVFVFSFRDFNPRPPRVGRQKGNEDIRKAKRISIHAPREGGDVSMIFSRSGRA